MGDSRILMDMEETAKVARKAPHAKVVAVHLESIDHCPTTRAELRAMAAEQNLAIWAPEDGEKLEF